MSDVIPHFPPLSEADLRKQLIPFETAPFETPYQNLDCVLYYQNSRYQHLYQIQHVHQAGML